MVTNFPTIDITEEETNLLLITKNDLSELGKTDVKCPRCEGTIVVTEYDTSYTIGCENDCVKIGFRGI